MVNRFLHKILVVLVLMSANLCVQAEELCMDGTLLFREDFGGNDPNDPVAGTGPAPESDHPASEKCLRRKTGTNLHAVSFERE